MIQRVVNETSSPQRDGSWLVGIEILRGVAALSVVFHHSWSLGTMPRFPGYWIVEGFGTWGVSLFFLLSGYLLADAFWKGERKGRLRRFYIRRVFRIVPAYYVNIAILFTFFAVHATLFSRTGFTQLLSNLSFTHYLRPETSSSLNVNGALWTLTIEAILYLVMPFLAWFTLVTRGFGVFVLIAAGLGYRLMVALAGQRLQDLYFDPGFDTAVARLFLARQFMGVLPLFALGIGLKWLVTQRGLRWRWNVPGPTAVTVVVLLLPSVLFLVFIERASFYTHWVWFTGFDFTLGVLFLPVLLFAASPTSSRGLIDRASAWLGERSYGLYLWHFPIILSVYGRGPLTAPPSVQPYVAKMALVLVLSLGAAALSWKAIEEPAQNVGRRLSNRRHRVPTPLADCVEAPSIA